MITVNYIVVKGLIFFLADLLSADKASVFSHSVLTKSSINRLCGDSCYASQGHCGRPVKAPRWTGHNHPPADNYDGSSESICVFIISESCYCTTELHLNELRDSPHTETQKENENE